MTDSIEPQSDAPVTPAKTPEPKRQRRTWKQRFKILVLILLIGVCIFRIALNMLLPTVIDKVAGIFGLQVGYQRLNLGLLGGTAHIWGLHVVPTEGGDPIAVCDYIEGNLSPFELLRGRLVVYRAEVDGVALNIERAADGSIPLLQKFAAAQSESAAPVVANKPTGPAKPISLDAPLRIDAIRLSHVTAKLRDRSVTPMFEATVRTSVRVSDVGLDNSPAKFELEVGVDPVVDTLRVTGEAHTSPTSVKADVQLLLRGLHPKAAAGYLTPLGLRPVANFMTVQANASITAETIPNSADFKASVAVDHVTAVADGQQWASLATLTLDAKKASTAGIELGTLAIADGFASAKRTADGHLQMAGIELAPVAAATAPAPAAQPAAPAVTVAGGPAFHASLDVLDLQRLQANVTDEAVSPAAAFVARLDSLSVKGVDTAATAPVPISLSAALPGIVNSVTVTGQAAPFAATKTVTLAVRAAGVKPDVLKPYMERFGLASQLADGHFTADVAVSVTPGSDGSITADAGATDVRFTDGDKSLVEMKTAKLAGVSYAAKTGAIGVKSIELSGPALAISRETDGHIASSGFTFMPPPAAPAQVSVKTETPSTTLPSTGPAMAGAVTDTKTGALVLPRIEISKITWSGVQLTLADNAAAPPTKLVIKDAGVELTDLLIDLAATDKQKPGTFRAWVSAPGLASNLSATGGFTPSPGSFALDATIAGDGLSGAPLAAYVRGLGIDPVLADGRVNARVTATLTQTAGPGDGTLSADFDLTDATYADGDTELAGVDGLHLRGITPSMIAAAPNPGPAVMRLDIADLAVQRPRARLAREADGALRAGGIRLVAVAPSTQPTTQPVAASTPASKPSTTALLQTLPVQLGLKKLRVDDATLDWADAAAPNGPAAIHFVGGVALDDFDVSPAAKPATLHATAKVDGSLKSATVDGTITPSPIAPTIDIKVTADGLAVGPLASYLPPTIQSSMQNGHFETQFAASVSNHDAGGLVAKVSVAGLRLAEVPAPSANDLLKVGTFTLAANRIDPAGEVFTIGELTASGVALDATQSPAGLEACGIRMVVAPPAAPATQPIAPPAAPPAAAAPAPSAPVASLASLVGDARRPLPAVSILKLDLGVDRVGLAGFTGPNAAPVELKDIHVLAPGPIAVGGRRADADAPIELKIAGGVEPIVKAFDVGLAIKAIANEPSIAVDLAAKGIRGDGLLAVLPSLKEKIDGSKLTDGDFATKLDATINYGRRGPRDFGIERGFTAEFNVKPLEFRAAPGTPVLAGLQAVHGEGIKVEPSTGNVTVKTLDVTTPSLRAYRDNEGIHAVGLTVKIGANEPVENLAPASQPTTPPAATPEAPPTPVVAAARPKNEIRLDHFTVSGIDAVIEDRTAEPTTIIPLKSLDVDVRDLSNQLPWSGKSTRFSVLVTSDKVPLPPRKGIKGDATSQPAGGAYTEQRELFSQVTANGKIGFARSTNSAGAEVVALDGWAKTAVNGFELLGVRGLAKPFGVTIGGGSFDDTNDVRFHPDGNIETKNKIVFTNLSLSEAANGPLGKLLKLPAPIDVAIGAVTDPDGSITLNLPVPIKNGAVTAGDVVGPALGAVTNVLVTGIASAPLKAVGGVGDLLGLGGNKDAKPEPPVIIGFLPAYDGLDAESKQAIATLAKQMKDDEALELQTRHSLTESDVARTSTRVNPPPEQALALAARVREEKADLLLRHDTLANEARGDLGAAATAKAKTTLAALRDVSDQIAKAETALDDLYALTGPSAAQQVDRRTRAASLELARRRLDEVRTALAAAGVANVDGRVHSTNPQFDIGPEDGGGNVTITLVRKKH